MHEEKYGKPIRTGWYFQQFLKLGFALSEYAKEYYLTWDADTIPLRHIDMFDAEGKPYFAMKTEYHKPYFDTMKRLLGINKIVPFSFIAEHMMFKVSLVKELISIIDNTQIEDSTWFEKVINATDFEAAKCSEMFSEFETYGTYCMNCYPDAYSYHKLNTLTVVVG